MAKKEISSNVFDEILLNKIYFIRGQKVMLDADLAMLYGVETRRLKEQVRRNINRFPEQFMFELSDEENQNLRSQYATLSHGKFSKYLPFAFTEHGILMLSNVLKSEKAIEVSIRIIEVFVKLRTFILDNAKLKTEIEEIKLKLNNQSQNIELVFKYLDELIEQKENTKPRTRIGYKHFD